MAGPFSVGEFLASNGKGDDGEAVPAGTYTGRFSTCYVGKNKPVVIGKFVITVGPIAGQVITVFFSASAAASGFFYRHLRACGLPDAFLESPATTLEDVADALEGREGALTVSVFAKKDGAETNSMEGFELTGAPPLPVAGGVPAAAVAAPLAQQQAPVLSVVPSQTPPPAVAPAADPVAQAQAALAAAQAAAAQQALDQAAVAAEMSTSTPPPAVLPPSVAGVPVQIAQDPGF